MLTRERIADLVGILATAAVAGVGAYIGGPIASGVMAGIGVNLSSSIIENGSSNLKERWLSSKDGVLNHDIQQALLRAFCKALTHLETKYFSLGETNALPGHAKASIRELFKELQRQAQQEFPTRLARSMREHEIKDYLYVPPEVASDKLWEQINRPDLLRTYDEDLKNFLRQNLLHEVQFWFGEELKTDTPACNKAWRAFQRLLLEGIQADVQAVRAQQDVIHQDMQKLEIVKRELDALRDVIDRRMPDEPFLRAFEKAVNDLRAMVQDVARTTQRTEDKLDVTSVDVKAISVDVKAIGVDVKRLLDARTGQGVSPASGTGLPPAPLPAVSEYFTGRAGEVQNVLDQLCRSRVVTLTGLGGIGKSEVAKAVGHAALGVEWAADGVYYVDLQSATDVNAVMSTLITGLGLQPTATAATLAQQLAGCRLYILDDLYQALVHNRQGVRALVRALHDYAAPTVRFLLTSRELIGVPGVEHPASLSRLLPPHDAMLFRTLADSHHYTWQAGDEERLHALLSDRNGLDGYPLALTIAANLLYGSSLQTLLRQWANRRTAVLKVPGIEAEDLDRLTSVDFSIALSFDRLPDGDARMLFTLFADLPAGATAETLEAMMGESWHDAITLLVHRSLVDVREGRYVMLVPIREFAARVRTDTCAPFRHKLDAYLLTLAEQWCQDETMWIHRQDEAVRLLATELPNLHAAMDRAHVRADHRFLANLTGVLHVFYVFALPGVEAKQRLQAGIVAARAIDDRLRAANCIQSLGTVHLRLDECELARARFEEALPIYRDIGDRLGAAGCIQSLGTVHLRLSEYELARERFEEALPIYRDIGSQLGAANCIRSLGTVHLQLDEYELARVWFEEALELFQSIGSRYNVARTLWDIGKLCAAEGHQREAVNWMEQSAQLFEEIGLTHWALSVKEEAEAWKRGETE